MEGFIEIIADVVIDAISTSVESKSFWPIIIIVGLIAIIGTVVYFY